jgi:D-ribose pyranose/furanose isomerase RbsD
LTGVLKNERQDLGKQNVEKDKCPCKNTVPEGDTVVDLSLYTGVASFLQKIE